MKKILTILIIVTIYALTGCVSSDEVGIRDSRESFMTKLQLELAENSIPFRVTAAGYIMYSKKHKIAVEKIIQDIQEVDGLKINEVGTRFEDEISNLCLRNLLDKKGISYRVVTRDSVDWTFWSPSKEEEQRKIKSEAITCAFEKKRSSGK